MGTIFISLSKRGSEVNRFMELPIYEYVEELLDGKGIRQFALTSGKVSFDFNKFLVGHLS